MRKSGKKSEGVPRTPESQGEQKIALGRRVRGCPSAAGFWAWRVLFPSPEKAIRKNLIGMAKASALDLGPFGITVNCIAPGPIATEMPMSILSKPQQDALAARTAVNRWARPEELIGPALLLASEAGSYITGTTMVVDGGWTAR